MTVVLFFEEEMIDLPSSLCIRNFADGVGKNPDAFVIDRSILFGDWLLRIGPKGGCFEALLGLSMGLPSEMASNATAFDT
jgi:hypothetical protein